MIDTCRDIATRLYHASHSVIIDTKPQGVGGGGWGWEEVGARGGTCYTSDNGHVLRQKVLFFNFPQSLGVLCIVRKL